MSAMSLVEVDCPGGRMRYLQGAYYTQPDLGGSVTTDTTITPWEYPPPDTIIARFFIVACG